MPRELRLGCTLALLAGVGLATGGCSYRIGALSGTEPPDAKAEVTSSLLPTAITGRSADGDLRAAKAAAVELLTRGKKDASQPWENPATGATGTVTAIATTYTDNGATCRDFMTSYLRGGQESWYRGDACRAGTVWKVRSLRPLRDS